MMITNKKWYLHFYSTNLDETKTITFSDKSSQWRSYTRARTGPGPGKFLIALVNYVRSTYLNHNSIAVYRIVMENKAANANF